MQKEKFQSIADMSWEEAATLSNLLFVEAYKLDERAENLLKKEKATPADCAEFTYSKRAAQKIRAEAREAWLSATVKLHSMAPNANKAVSHKLR